MWLTKEQKITLLLYENILRYSISSLVQVSMETGYGFTELGRARDVLIARGLIRYTKDSVIGYDLETATLELT